MKTAAFPVSALASWPALSSRLTFLHPLPELAPPKQTIDPEELHVDSASYLPPAHSGALGAAVRLVEVLAVVRDKEGRPVQGLTRADFEVRDENKKREADGVFRSRGAGSHDRRSGPGGRRARSACRPAGPQSNRSSEPLRCSSTTSIRNRRTLYRCGMAL